MLHIFKEHIPVVLESVDLRTSRTDAMMTTSACFILKAGPVPQSQAETHQPSSCLQGLEGSAVVMMGGHTHLVVSSLCKDLQVSVCGHQRAVVGASLHTNTLRVTNDDVMEEKLQQTQRQLLHYPHHHHTVLSVCLSVMMMMMEKRSLSSLY